MLLNPNLPRSIVPYPGRTSRTSHPISASALGSAPQTSASPPVLANGKQRLKEVIYRCRNIRGSLSRRSPRGEWSALCRLSRAVFQVNKGGMDVQRFVRALSAVLLAPALLLGVAAVGRPPGAQGAYSSASEIKIGAVLPLTG